MMPSSRRLMRVRIFSGSLVVQGMILKPALWRAATLTSGLGPGRVASVRETVGWRGVDGRVGRVGGGRWRVETFGILHYAQDDRRNLLEQWLQSVSWRRAERFPLWAASFDSAVERSRLSFCMTMAVFTLLDFSRS